MFRRQLDCGGDGCLLMGIFWNVEIGMVCIVRVSLLHPWIPIMRPMSHISSASSQCRSYSYAAVESATRKSSRSSPRFAENFVGGTNSSRALHRQQSISLHEVLALASSRFIDIEKSIDLDSSCPMASIAGVNSSRTSRPSNPIEPSEPIKQSDHRSDGIALYLSTNGSAAVAMTEKQLQQLKPAPIAVVRPRMSPGQQNPKAASIPGFNLRSNLNSPSLILLP